MKLLPIVAVLAVLALLGYFAWRRWGPKATGDTTSYVPGRSGGATRTTQSFGAKASLSSDAEQGGGVEIIPQPK